MLTGQPRTGALAPDVFPAFGPQAFSGAAFINEHHLTAANHAADLTDAHSRDLRRDLLRRGEQQFVVLTAVEGHIQSNRAGRLSHQRTRDECGLNFGAHAAFFTEVAEVGGEAVAEVDHGGGQTAPAQELTDSYPGLGVEVAGGVCGLVFFFRREAPPAPPPIRPIRRLRIYGLRRGRRSEEWLCPWGPTPRP